MLAQRADDELLHRLSELLQRSRRVESALVAHIAEVDARRLYAREAAPSMFAYCTQVLHLSEAEAYLRIAAARASRKHPVLLEMLSEGRLHLSGIDLLAPHLTEANRNVLLCRAAYQSKRKIQELVAEIAPKPDVPGSMRKRPAPRRKSQSAAADQLGPDPVGPSTTPAPTRPEQPPKPSAERPAVEPLAPERYKVQFTASAELHDKLERLQALLRSSVPDGDLAKIIEAAVTEKLERLEAKRFGKSKTPRKSVEESDTSPSSRYIPASVRRAVIERDGGRCAFVDTRGRRCNERHALEFHHRNPFARGGDRRPENIQLACRAHNIYMAEQDYGKDVMKRYRRSPDRVSEPAAAYGVRRRAALTVHSHS